MRYMRRSSGEGFVPGTHRRLRSHACDAATFPEKAGQRGIERLATTQANVLQLDQLPVGWTNYDLIVSASMLEYMPRERLAEALAGLRSKLAVKAASHPVHHQAQLAHTAARRMVVAFKSLQQAGIGGRVQGGWISLKPSFARSRRRRVIWRRGDTS